MEALSLLRMAIKDACIDFLPVSSLEEADTVISLEEFQCNILKQLDLKLNKKEKDAVTLNFLKSELLRNNLFSTKVNLENGSVEVWMLKKNKY